MTTWDSTVDFVIVGSGGGGMVAALAAADAGASALVLEKQALVGGSTAMSGGIVWVPDNPVMRADGVADSYEDAMAHFEAVVGDVGPASSFERRHAFLTAGPGDGRRSSSSRGVRFVHCPGYSDYYSNAKGGHDVGRGHRAGALRRPRARRRGSTELQPGLAQEPRPGGDDERGALAVALQPQRRRVRASRPGSCSAPPPPGPGGQALLTNGASLIAQMLQHRARPRASRSGPRRRSTTSSSRTAASSASARCATARRCCVRARQGVLLAAGGFAHNAEMRGRVRRRPAEPGQVVDRQPRRHRRGARRPRCASAPRPT